jgi:long-chain acyl-CoA synthetase
MGIRSFSFYDMICRNSRLYPGRDAVICGDRRLSFLEYRERCDAVAAGLVRAGIRKRDRIVVLGRNSDRFLMLYGAAAAMGAVIVPLNWRSNADEVQYMLRDCTPRLIFADGDYFDMLSGIAPATGFAGKIYSLDGRAAEGVLDFERLCSEEGNVSREDIEAEEAFAIMYTAAVGGRPRGALLNQANILAVNTALIDLFGLTAADCNICSIPLFHIGGLSMCAAVMQQGGRNVIMERFEPEEALKLIEAERVSVFFSFAPMLKMMNEKIAGQDLSSVRAVSGLEPPDQVAAFFSSATSARFYSFYGQTEAMAVTGAPAAERPGSVGRPTILSRVVLFDDYDNEVPPGSAGEICVRSPAVFLGYWDQDSSYTFRNGWHHTGDIGRFDRDGYLWYVKRKAEKELIKTGGENVYPAEVEKALLAHSLVAEASVFGVADKDWGEAVAAAVVLKENAGLQKSELLEFLSGQLPAFKRPKHIIFAESLPKTSEGEIDRAKVRELYSGQS